MRSRKSKATPVTLSDAELEVLLVETFNLLYPVRSSIKMLVHQMRLHIMNNKRLSATTHLAAYERVPNVITEQLKAKKIV